MYLCGLMLLKCETCGIPASWVFKFEESLIKSKDLLINSLSSTLLLNERYLEGLILRIFTVPQVPSDSLMYDIYVSF